MTHAMPAPTTDHAAPEKSVKPAHATRSGRTTRVDATGCVNCTDHVNDTDAANDTDAVNGTDRINGTVRVDGTGHGGTEASRGNAAARPAKPYAVRRSAIHGRGVFATAPIRKGTRIIEYKGKRVDWAWASRAYAPVQGEPTHTFLFELDDGRVIDANQGGNAARWINHSCKPNCQAVEEDGRVYIEALRAIRPGEELGYDYRIQLEERLTPTEKKRWPCHCGAKDCRGTLLVPKRR